MKIHQKQIRAIKDRSTFWQRTFRNPILLCNSKKLHTQNPKKPIYQPESEYYKWPTFYQLTGQSQNIIGELRLGGIATDVSLSLQLNGAVHITHDRQFVHQFGGLARLDVDSTGSSLHCLEVVAIASTIRRHFADEFIAVSRCVNALCIQTLQTRCSGQEDWLIEIKIFIRITKDINE